MSDRRLPKPTCGLQRAREILSSPDKWNRADNRRCPDGAKTVSLYCALEKAMDEVSGDFKHRGAAMQEARFVIDDVAPNRKEYGSRNSVAGRRGRRTRTRGSALLHGAD
jgi:hypothetical protein